MDSTENKTTADAPRRKSPVAVGGVVVTLLAALLGVNLIWSVEHCDELRGPRRGKPAPDFSLKTPQGKETSLASLRGKVVLLDFWASWCRPCVQKFPALEAMQGEHGASGLQVLAINMERERDIVERFERRRTAARARQGQKESGLIYLLDDNKVSATYSVQTLPHVVVVGRDGKVVFTLVGGGGLDRLRQEVKAALAK